MIEPSEPIEAYLDALQQRLAGSPREVRRMVAEAESHLYDALDAGLARGLSQSDAERAALEQFGTPGEVGAAHAAQRRTSWRDLSVRAVRQFAPLVAVGLLAIGASGLVARLMVAVWSPTTVFADASGTRYGAGECHNWLSIHPHAPTCTAAYIAESMADGLQLRYAAGVLGLALALALLLWRRWRPVRPVMPAVVPAFAALVAFGLVGIGLLALGLDQVRIADGHGSGQWLSAAVVALPIAGYYLWRFVSRLRDVVGGPIRALGHDAFDLGDASG
jgi:hypothetical protein